MALTDQDTGVVDGLGKAELVDASLEAALQEVLDLQGQDVIELHAALVKDTDTDQTTNERIALEQTLGVLLVESEELTEKIVSRAFGVKRYVGGTNRAARRILERVSWTRQTSRLLRRPNSPTVFNSASLDAR